MATTTSLGLPIFTATDNLTPLAGTLNLISNATELALKSSNRIISVADVAGRTALVTSTGSVNISAAKPLMVWRADAPAGAQLEYTTNGATWHSYNSTEYVGPLPETNWIDCTLSPNVTARTATYRPQVRRDKSGMVHFRGQFNPPTSPTGTSVELCIVPEGFRPAFEQRFMAFQTAVGHNPFGGYLSSAGVLGMQTPSGRSPQYPTSHFAIVCPPWSLLGPDN